MLHSTTEWSSVMVWKCWIVWFTVTFWMYENISLCCVIIWLNLNICYVLQSGCFSKVIVISMYLNPHRNGFKMENDVLSWCSQSPHLNHMKNIRGTLIHIIYANNKYFCELTGSCHCKQMTQYSWNIIYKHGQINGQQRICGHKK